MAEINQNLVEFLKKLAADEELQAKMQKAANPDEAYAVASAVQDGFTKEEFVETMAKINDQTNKELSDDDLAQVAGGKSWKEWLSITVETVTRTITAAAKAAI